MHFRWTTTRTIQNFGVATVVGTCRWGQCCSVKCGSASRCARRLCTRTQGSDSRTLALSNIRSHGSLMNCKRRGGAAVCAGALVLLGPPRRKKTRGTCCAHHGRASQNDRAPSPVTSRILCNKQTDHAMACPAVCYTRNELPPLRPPNLGGLEADGIGPPNCPLWDDACMYAPIFHASDTLMWSVITTSRSS